MGNELSDACAEAAESSIIVERDEQGYATACAARGFAKGECVARFGAREVLDAPTYLTVQTGEDRHILLSPENLQYTNHSCDPNVFFDTDRGEVTALRDVAAGDPVTFFYPSTEWTMDRPFACHCGSARCLGEIAGAAQMDRQVLDQYRLASHIVRALESAKA